jgi:hypothetical protein
MKPSPLDENMGNSILNQIHEGMRVCDNRGQDIGSVRQVFLGAVSEQANEQGRGPATASNPEWRDESLVDNLAEAFSADEPLPEALRGRLLRHGFIRIDTSGIFASDRFALPDQIESISEDCVRLRLTKDELIER